MATRAPETSPADVRAGLVLITGAAAAAVAAIVANTIDQGVAAVRRALFAAVPLIAHEYAGAAAELGAAWYDALRDASGSGGHFLADPVTLLDEDGIRASIAKATERLLADIEPVDLAREYNATLAAVESSIQKDVANAMRETVSENVKRDGEAVGYQRFTRGPDACPFCRLLADKGAIFKKETAYFAAHTDCHCLAGPVFKDQADRYPDASVVQYTASSKHRTQAERDRLRDYLRNKYGEASAPH